MDSPHKSMRILMTNTINNQNLILNTIHYYFKLKNCVCIRWQYRILHHNCIFHNNLHSLMEYNHLLWLLRNHNKINQVMINRPVKKIHNLQLSKHHLLIKMKLFILLKLLDDYLCGLEILASVRFVVQVQFSFNMINHFHLNMHNHLHNWHQDVKFLISYDRYSRVQYHLSFSAASSVLPLFL